MTPMDGALRLRRAVPEDSATLWQFQQALIEFERVFDTRLRAEGIVYYDVDALMASDDSEVAVMERGGQIVASGYVQLRDVKPIYHHTQIGHVGFLYVTPAHRGQGLVQQLLNHFGEWARSRGVDTLELEVYAHNAAAVSAYERAGFEPTLTKMALKLSP